MNKRKIRDSLRLMGAIVFGWLYIPHLLVYAMGGGKKVIDSDLCKHRRQVNISLKANILLLIYLLHNNRWFRNIFYYRIGPMWDLLIGWWRMGDKSLIIPYSTKIGEGLLMAHAYSTVLNAESIGDNFSFIHCTTIGKKGDKRPVIGDNVTLGANVVIIGDVKIGNNVVIGAGSVVVKDIPDNSVAVGNPARVIKTLSVVE